MDKVMIGTILKKRIKEKNFKQSKFAEEAGIGLSTLRKYMNGKLAYNYEILVVFAEKLDCSFDYLLGFSKSPQKEYHEVTEQTRLSEKTIEKLNRYAKLYDKNFEARRYIKCLDMIIQEDRFFASICDYLISSKYLNDLSQGFLDLMQDKINHNPSFQEIGVLEDRRVTLEQQYMIEIIGGLKDIKNKMTPEFIAELKELGMEEDYLKAVNVLKNFQFPTASRT